MMHSVYLGVDLGTSGVRAVALDGAGRLRAEARVVLPESLRDGDAVEQEPRVWRDACRQVLAELAQRLKSVPGPLLPVALAVDGTSATLMAVDGLGNPLSRALMYNDSRSREEARRIARLAPPECAALGPSAALAKALWLQRRHPGLHRFLHQAEWIAGWLAGDFRWGDENNALKLGYDPIARTWPGWLGGLGISGEKLPQVVPPGRPIGHIQPALARELGLPEALRICAGTTDSTAAFLATGAGEPGEGGTVLGSTLVVKLLSERPVNAPRYGIYSHRLGDLWLVGGASNSGGAVLLDHFTPGRLHALSQRIDPERPTGFDYYPLRCPGERFPVVDPDLAPRLSPRPADPVRFLQGMLEGMAEIEARGYRLLEELGAPPLSSVRTTGGGAVNRAWSAIRARRLGVPLLPARYTEAACGAARLACQSPLGSQNEAAPQVLSQAWRAGG